MNAQRATRFRFVFTATVALLMSAHIANSESPSCLTTLPATGPSFVPSPPYWLVPADGTFWYGSDALWTALPDDGVWHVKDNVDKNGGYATKLIFWHNGFDWRKEREPNFTLTGKRLDADAPAIVIRGCDPVFAPAVGAMMIGLDVPTTGCWKFAARYHAHALTFVVLVEQ